MSDDRIRVLAADVDRLCDQFYEAGFRRGVAWRDEYHEGYMESDVAAALGQARSEHWASLRGRLAALMEER